MNHANTTSSPMVSVIIPVYNASAFLRQCLDSILSSTLQHMEIIAVDDGSTDGSSQILDQYAEKYKIVVLHQENRGVSNARNAGLDVAHGEYIGFVDSDDWIEANMYEIMYQSAKNNQADIVWCNIYKNENTPMKAYLPGRVYDAGAIRENFFPYLISNSNYRNHKKTLQGSIWCRLFSRELLRKHHIRFCEQITNNEDQLFCIQATLHAQCYVYLADQYLYHYRVVSSSLTRRYLPHMWEKQHLLLERLQEVTQTTDYDFTPQIHNKILEIAEYSIFFDTTVSSPLSTQQQLQRIRLICNSDILRSALAKIDHKQLQPIRKAIYWALRLHCYRMARYLIQYRSSRRG